MPTHSKTANPFRLAQFGLVGLINTAVGYLVIVTALSFGAADVPANAAGYAVGLAVSFGLNSKWTFRDRARPGFGSAFRYVAIFGIAYGANLVIVTAGTGLGYAGNPIVHLAGICVYSVVFYTGARTLVFIDRPDVEWRALLLSRWPEIFLVCVVAGAWLAMHDLPVSHDVVWQMWIARQLLGGAKLYSDILEINPPLWFWLAVPVERSAQLLGAPQNHAITTAVFGYIMVAQLAVSGLIAEYERWRRALMLAVTMTASIALPLFDFGQREHLALIAAIPYAMLIARRAEGRQVHWYLALVVGLTAAIGFALKHYFAAVPLILELWLLSRDRKTWKPVRIETLVLGCAALFYAAAILFVTPAYITNIVPMVKLAYFGYDTILLNQLVRPFVIFWFFAVLTWVYLRSLASSLTNALMIAGAAFMLSYFLQQKGFHYHAVPATGMLFVGVGSLLMLKRLERPSSHIVAGTMLMPLVAAAMLGPYRNVHDQWVSGLLDQAERGKPVMMLAANPSTIWPMVEENGYVWPSRHFAMWMLTAFGKQLRAEGRLSPAMEEMAREVRAQTAADLACNPPDLIIVDNLTRSKARGINAVEFFSVDPDFRSLFTHYRKARVADNFTSYLKDADWQPVHPPSCRRVF